MKDNLLLLEFSILMVDLYINLRRNNYGVH